MVVVFDENFHPSKRFGMWPPSWPLFCFSSFPSAHTTCPLFLPDSSYPPARKPEVQKTSVISLSLAAAVCFQLKFHLELMFEANSPCESCLFSQLNVWKISNVQKRWKNFLVNTHIPTTYILPIIILLYLLYCLLAFLSVHQWIIFLNAVQDKLLTSVHFP